MISFNCEGMPEMYHRPRVDMDDIEYQNMINDTENSKLCNFCYLRFKLICKNFEQIGIVDKEISLKIVRDTYLGCSEFNEDELQRMIDNL